MSMPSDFEKLPTVERRLVGKFISTLCDSKLEETARRKIIRTLRRASRSSEKDSRKKRNGYTLYYCSRFPQVKNAHGSAKVCDIAKIVAAEWKNLAESERFKYSELAKASREEAVHV